MRRWDCWWLSLPGGLEAGIWQTQIKGCLELPAASNSISCLLLPLFIPSATSPPLFLTLLPALVYSVAMTTPTARAVACQGSALRSPDAGRLHRRPLSHYDAVQFSHDGDWVCFWMDHVQFCAHNILKSVCVCVCGGGIQGGKHKCESQNPISTSSQSCVIWVEDGMKLPVRSHATGMAAFLHEWKLE